MLNTNKGIGNADFNNNKIYMYKLFFTNQKNCTIIFY